MSLNRRQFLKSMGIATACTCTGVPLLNSCSMLQGISKLPVLPDDSYTIEDGRIVISIKKYPDLTQSGTAVKFTAVKSNGSEQKVVLLHNNEGEFLAFSDNCTHADRELNFLPEKQELQCSSFGHSRFDLDGNVLKGPAKNNLAGFSVISEKQKLIIMI